MSQFLAALAWISAAYCGGFALALALEAWLRRHDRHH